MDVTKRFGCLFNEYCFCSFGGGCMMSDDHTNDAKAIAVITKLVDLALQLSLILELYYMNNNHL
ncbi:hypothetical protein T4B_5294, partial [Trichinella pseudospiralis]|uniref:Uncharacterized protein n=1 Tax=Trichinella pseudospiralis TaxID=6337 RepID=A0A0V0Y6Y2_TRIPS